MSRRRNSAVRRGGAWWCRTPWMGAAYVAQLRREDPAIVPHALPDAQRWAELLQGLPLRLEALVDEAGYY